MFKFFKKNKLPYIILILVFTTISFYGYSQPVVLNITQNISVPKTQKTFAHTHYGGDGTTDLNHKVESH